VALSRTLDRVGLVLGGRYRLLAPIGTGASASVYLADDVKLRRRVAVKVLHEALAEDEAFLRRFQAEAQSAAALNHPHVMAVHDWGDSGEWPYLVMELLGGGSLRAVFDAGPPLSLSQALVVGLEAARGLDYAHRRGFVHRDIKPANLLFDDEARLRIADFGLARALAEAAWTEPMGAVLGTARYASPEQARGESLDGRSDVYSLALVLIEAVTSTVPFRADTTIGTLMARVDRPIPVPVEMGALAPVLRAAGVADPRERIDAATFGAALLAAAEDLDRPRPIPLPGTVLVAADLSEIGRRDPTDVAGVAGEENRGSTSVPVLLEVPAAEPSASLAAGSEPMPLRDPLLADDITGFLDLRNEAGHPGSEAGHPAPFDWQEDVDPGARRTRRESRRRDAGRPGNESKSSPFNAEHVTVDGAEPVRVESVWVESARAEPGGSDRSALDALADVAPASRSTRRERRTAAPTSTRTVLVEAADHRSGRRRRRGRAMLIVLLVGGLAAAAGYGGWYTWVRIPEHRVPSFVGTTADTAKRTIADNGWQVRTSEMFAEGSNPGEVLAQRPSAGLSLEERQLVELTISLGSPPIAVPTDLAGKSLDEAGAALAAVGLGIEVAERPFDENVAKGVVIALMPDTLPEVSRSTPVRVVVSAGPEPRIIPADLVGDSDDVVTSQLAMLGLLPSIVEEFDENVQKGIVLAVSPASGETAEKGSSVKVTVSKGPSLVAVPNVRGLSVVDAATRIEAQGLVVSGTQGSPTKPVVGTNPAAGALVRRGTPVTITTE